MKDIVIYCPNCGKSHYIILDTVSTAVYYRPIFENGVNVNPDKNSRKAFCRCLNCGTQFSYESNSNRDDFGKIKSI
jgi:transcription elongation factor Elf1